MHLDGVLRREAVLERAAKRMRSLPLVASAAFALHAAASEPASWRIDSARSEARFEVTLRLPVHADGRFKKMDGEVTVLPDFKRSVRVRLDARELKMGGPDWVQSYTVSEQFLDTGRYPAIEFQSLPFSEQVLISGGELAGTLSLKAVSKPVLLILTNSNNLHRADNSQKTTMSGKKV